MQVLIFGSNHFGSRSTLLLKCLGPEHPRSFVTMSSPTGSLVPEAAAAAAAAAAAFTAAKLGAPPDGIAVAVWTHGGPKVPAPQGISGSFTCSATSVSRLMQALLLSALALGGTFQPIMTAGGTANIPRALPSDGETLRYPDPRGASG